MKTLIAIVTITIIYSTHAAQIDYTSVPKKGSTTFEAVGKPAMIKIKGESDAPKSTLSFNEGKASLQAELILDELKTGIDMRDEHMKEKYLEIKKHPATKLVIASLDLPVDWDKNPTNISGKDFTGTLSLHGKDAPVKGTFSIDAKRSTEAEFQIKLTDYNIETPDYLGIKVAETVTIKTKIQFERK